MVTIGKVPGSRLLTVRDLGGPQGGGTLRLSNSSEMMREADMTQKTYGSNLGLKINGKTHSLQMQNNEKYFLSRKKPKIQLGWPARARSSVGCRESGIRIKLGLLPCHLDSGLQDVGVADALPPDTGAMMAEGGGWHRKAPGGGSGEGQGHAGAGGEGRPLTEVSEHGGGKQPFAHHQARAPGRRAHG